MNSILHYEQYFKQPEIGCQASDTEILQKEDAGTISQAHANGHKICPQLYPDLPIVTADLEETSLEYAPFQSTGFGRKILNSSARARSQQLMLRDRRGLKSKL